MKTDCKIQIPIQQKYKIFKIEEIAMLVKHAWSGDDANLLCLKQGQSNPKMS